MCANCSPACRRDCSTWPQCLKPPTHTHTPNPLRNKSWTFLTQCACWWRTSSTWILGHMAPAIMAWINCSRSHTVPVKPQIKMLRGVPSPDIYPLTYSCSAVDLFIVTLGWIRSQTLLYLNPNYFTSRPNSSTAGPVIHPQTQKRQRTLCAPELVTQMTAPSYQWNENLLSSQEIVD